MIVLSPKRSVNNSPFLMGFGFQRSGEHAHTQPVGTVKILSQIDRGGLGPALL